jgi:mRNA-degrading endonuclease toxin of MazEF toxin-antitoxin module
VTCCSPTWIRWQAANGAVGVPSWCFPARPNELRNEQLIVAAITGRPRGLPFHIPVGTDCGLRAPSWVQSESARAISAQRVSRHLGRARPETVAEVRNRVINFLRDW